MLTIIYGEDIVKSRNFLDQLKKENQKKEIINLDGRKLDLTGLKQAMEAGTMFDSDRVVIVEDLFSTRSKTELTKTLNYIALKQYSNELVLWLKDNLSKTALTKLKAEKVFEFKLEAVLFKFLDSLRPNNQTELLALMHRCIKAERPEIIQYMMVSRLRYLILLKEKIEDTDEIKKMQPWQKGKLTKQADYFTLDSLLKIYRALLQIEVEQKTGTAVFSLEKALELLITNV